MENEWIIFAIAIFGTISIIGIPSILILKFHKVHSAKASEKLHEILERYTEKVEAEENLTCVEFTVYYGFLAYWRQTKVKIRVTHGKASELLKELHSFNVKNCWLSPGGVFIPFLSKKNLNTELKKLESGRREH